MKTSKRAVPEHIRAQYSPKSLNSIFAFWKTNDGVNPLKTVEGQLAAQEITGEDAFNAFARNQPMPSLVLDGS